MFVKRVCVKKEGEWKRLMLQFSELMLDYRDLEERAFFLNERFEALNKAFVKHTSKKKPLLLQNLRILFHDNW